MRRLLVVLWLPVVTAASCAPAPGPPARPIADEQVMGSSGLDVASAREATLAFLSAYADASTHGVDALRSLVAGPQLRSWVHWLDVQNHEFDGTIDGAVDVRSAGFVGLVPLRGAVGGQVDLGASVTFSFTPADGDAFRRTRILDGPVTLLRAGTADWKIVDLTRDGVSMDAGITRLDHVEQRAAGVAVRLDSVFAFVPNWQFNVVVTNHGAQPLSLDPKGTALLVKQADGIAPVAVVTTRSLREVSAGARVEALADVPFQESSRGLVLVLSYRTPGGEALRFSFPLGDLIDRVPSPATGGASGASASS